jgi:exodeoxyribonuclease V alpha subunit
VMVLRNDYVLKTFNGDIGIALPDGGGGLAVAFPDGEAGYRFVPLARMSEHETAYVLTVHKAQGAEFGSVLTVLPQQPSHVVTRELLYTAITRAKKTTRVSVSAGLLNATVASQAKYFGALFDRVRV